MIAAATFLVPSAVVAQEAFEGSIKAVMAASGMEIVIEQHTRGQMFRQDMNMPSAGGSISVISNNADDKTIMLIHDQKMWMDMAMMRQMMRGMMGRAQEQAATETGEMPEVRRTDRTETIAGHECRHYMVMHKDGEIDLCAATGMGFFMPTGGVPSMAGMGRSQGPSMPELPKGAEKWAKEFADGFFVLKMQAQTEQGPMSWTVQSIEKKKLPDELFKPPAGYNEMKMPGR